MFQCNCMYGFSFQIFRNVAFFSPLRSTNSIHFVSIHSIQFDSIHILSLGIWNQFLKQMIFRFCWSVALFGSLSLMVCTCAHLMPNGFHLNWMRINFNCVDEWLNNYNYHYTHSVVVFIGFHWIWCREKKKKSDRKFVRSLVFWSSTKCWSHQIELFRQIRQVSKRVRVKTTIPIEKIQMCTGDLLLVLVGVILLAYQSLRLL